MILPRRVPRAAMRILKRHELRLAWTRLLDRERVVGEVVRKILGGADPTRALEELVSRELGKRPAELVLSEVRAFRAQMEALDLLAAGDLEEVRRALAERMDAES